MENNPHYGVESVLLEEINFHESACLDVWRTSNSALVLYLLVQFQHFIIAFFNFHGTTHGYGIAIIIITAISTRICNASKLWNE